MDGQNNQGDQDNGQITPAGTPPPYTPPSPLVQPVPAAPQPTVSLSKNKSNLKKLLLLLAGIVLIAIAAGALWYFVLSDNSNSAHTANNKDASTEEPIETVAFSQPDQLIYFRNDGDETPYTVYARSVASGDEVAAITLPGKTSPNNSSSAIRNNQVVFATTPDYNSGEKEAIYYSDDSGKSYKKIYTAESMDTQITSLVFSTDGKALAVGILPSLDGRNQVTEISLEGDNATKTLFAADAHGVFIKGYDRDKQKVIYFTGCYNCDGFIMKDMYVYDIAVEKQDLLYSTDPMLLSVAINEDFTKVLALHGELGEEYFSTKAPYELFTIDIATKAKEAIKTFDDGEALLGAGYTPEGNPYLTTNSRVRELADDKLNTLLESSDSYPYNQLLFAGTNGAIEYVMTSSPEESATRPTYAIIYSKPGDPAPVEIMKISGGGGMESLIGVTRK